MGVKPAEQAILLLLDSYVITVSFAMIKDLESLLFIISCVYIGCDAIAVTVSTLVTISSLHNIVSIAIPIFIHVIFIIPNH